MTRPNSFPSHFKIILTEYERLALDTLYERDPHLLDALELIHDVIAAGIRAKNQTAESRKDTGAQPTRSEIETSKARNALASRAALPAETSPFLIPTPHRHIESYIAFPIDERLRQDLEDFLDANESMTEETAFAFLLARGLDSDAQGRAPRSAVEVVEAVGGPSGSRRARRSLRRRQFHRLVGS